ncbi:MAG: type II secretion system protein GspG [Candidatus Hydrogenedentes bacterium]|nr:type II secretion system protein GspG [Candidatus Hydrogenedentota bacterium]
MFESLPNSFLTVRGDVLGDQSETDRFTALERIAVIVVVTPCICLGALGLFDILFYRWTQFEQGEIAAAKAQIKQFDTALTAYKMKFGELPENLDQLLLPPSGEPIMNAKVIPVDPWDTPYLYLKLDSKSYVIVSLGADGEPSGDGKDADIRSDELTNEAAQY